MNPRFEISFQINLTETGSLAIYGKINDALQTGARECEKNQRLHQRFQLLSRVTCGCCRARRQEDSKRFGRGRIFVRMKNFARSAAVHFCRHRKLRSGRNVGCCYIRQGQMWKCTFRSSHRDRTWISHPSRESLLCKAGMANS